jgi:general secretion pathway protein A
MYTKFFGLNEKPFAITPDPRYLFMSERHGEGLAHLVYGVTESGGFIQLTGEVGTGKTTLVRTLLGQMPSHADVALILNPQLTAMEFLLAICDELKLRLPEGENSTKTLVDALNRHLLSAHAAGRRTVLMIDEAQNLSADVLEQIRLLTNLETAKRKLLQIILIAQPELREKLSMSNLRQLAQRITGRYHLEPLSREESVQYIDHRLKVAGALGEIFDDAAKREVFNLSGGVPRLINVICDRALLGAYSRDTRSVNRRLVRKAAAEVSGQAMTPTLFKWAVPVVIAAGLVLALYWFWPQAQEQQQDAVEVSIPLSKDASATPEIIPEPAMNTEVPDDGASALEEALRNSVSDVDAATAMTALSELWGISYDATAGTGCSQAQAQGLSCLFLRGTWNAVRQLDRPAILTLTDSAGANYRPVLVAMDDNGAELVIDGERVTYSQEQISPFWFGQYMLMWRPPNGQTEALRRGMRGDNVRWLRESLANLDPQAADAAGDSDLFDEELEFQLMDFQRRNRLQVDGLAGQQTQIIINTQLDLKDTPRLTASMQ